MNSTKHLKISISLFICIFIAGTSGYMVLEGWSLLDSVYMTAITITTVGFKEVRHIDKIGQIFTVFLVFIGVGFTMYVAGAVVQFLVEGQLRIMLGRKKLDKKISLLNDHYIICGYGRIGSVICDNLRKKPFSMVVIEKNVDAVPAMDENGILYVSGDASEETNLINAGIKKAKGLIAALATDADNVFLVLTAKQLNPSLNIIARACHDKSKSKLIAAGADIVASPYEVGAMSMAQRVLRPAVTNFLDLALTHERKDIQMEEIPINPYSSIQDVSLKDSGIRQKFNLIIIAINKSDGSMLFNPSFETVLKSNDTVIAVGESKNLNKLENILNPDVA